jgi:hypothetical protein
MLCIINAAALNNEDGRVEKLLAVAVWCPDCGCLEVDTTFLNGLDLSLFIK